MRSPYRLTLALAALLSTGVVVTVVARQQAARSQVQTATSAPAETTARIVAAAQALLTTLDDSGREVIIEVGNIVLNACLGVFGNLLQVQISFTVPHLQVDDVEHIMRSIRIQDQSFRYALMIHTRFHLRASDVSGYLVMILGVTSLERVIQELRKWEERELS